MNQDSKSHGNGDAAASARSRGRERALRTSRLELADFPTPVQELSRLGASLGAAPRLLVKRDDAIDFAFGGNKVRKIEFCAARAVAEGADTLVTVGGVQSNHARVTAAVAAKLGMRAVLVANGAPSDAPRGNALLDALLGAEVVYVASRKEREPTMNAIVERLRREGRRPFPVPLGASTALGALGFVGAIEELMRQIPPPDVIVHASSSGGTQAGLIAGCRLLGLRTRIIGVSADEPRAHIESRIAVILRELADLLECPPLAETSEPRIEVDDGFVGPGYGVPTPPSQEALERVARTEALFLDPTYTAKAMAGLISYLRAGRFAAAETVLFWHTGGQVGLFR